MVLVTKSAGYRNTDLVLPALRSNRRALSACLKTSLTLVDHFTTLASG
jgi:hypothetical protein